MKKLITIIAVAALTYSAATAQYFNRNEFSINVGGGASSFQTQTTEGKDLWNWTGTAGLGYHFFFNPNWGIGTGANFAIYNGGICINNYSQLQATTNALHTSNAFDFLVTSTNYKNVQQAMMVTIPLMVQYQTEGKAAFYAALGAKVGIPILAKSKTEGNFTTKGYYPNPNVTYEDLPEYGFVNNMRFPENETNIKLRTFFMASAELGVKWRLSYTTSLYTGIYADYGLNDMMVKEPAPANSNLVVYQPETPAEFAYNTATNSFAKQIAPLACGITLRLSYSLEGKAAAAAAKKKEEAEAKKQADEVAAQQAAVERARQEELNRLQREAQRLAAENARLEKEKQAAIAAQQAAEKRAATKESIQQPVELYAISQTELTATQKQNLDEKVALLQEYPDMEMFIYGHTCDIGSYAINQKIGLQRAENAKTYIISQGIDAARIVGTATKGYSEPLVPNINEENRRQNRRIEIIVVE